MFVRTIEDVERAGRVLSLLDDTAKSARYIVAADRIGFSYNNNRVGAGYDATLWYRHHWEANYIVAGHGSVEDLATGESWTLDPGALYVVGPNDRHRIRATEDMHLVSIWNPALNGDERHDEDGGYPPTGPVPETERRMFVKRADAMRAAGEELTVGGGQIRTLRLLTKADGLPFGFSDVHFVPGAENVLWYKHHWELNHILSGSGEVADLTTGESWKLEPGTTYNVGPKDRHRVRAHTELHLLSVFSPPLVGDERHDADGAFRPTGPVPPGPPGY